jgi:hypothetical protein
VARSEEAADGARRALPYARWHDLNPLGQPASLPASPTVAEQFSEIVWLCMLAGIGAGPAEHGTVGPPFTEAGGRTTASAPIETIEQIHGRLRSSKPGIAG